MYKIILGITYNGKYFYGWQQQKNLLTLQKYIEIILSLIIGYNIKIFSSGRTDKNVNAIEQIITFTIIKNLKLKFLLNSINYYIRANIKILWVQNICLSFNVRKDSIIRNYRYIIYNDKFDPLFLKKKIFCFHKHINYHNFKNIKNKMLGMNNYKSFSSTNCNNKNTIKHILDIKIFNYNKFLIFEITANSFLYNMIRYLVGFFILKNFNILTHKKIYKLIVPAYGLYFIKSYYSKKFFLKYNKKFMQLL
ncbi:MAG: tRNA pseudouridine(38-40) synthase TruA [Candidatus Azosocius agrarius]|nr:MAG: tRNA pseudouridine(38-40) synthase TruA [Gammaproteobacteria bacterium]